MASCCAHLFSCLFEHQHYAVTVLPFTLSQWMFVAGTVGKSFADVRESVTSYFLGTDQYGTRDLFFPHSFTCLDLFNLSVSVISVLI